MKLALLQMDVRWEDRPANLRRAAALMEEAAGGGAALAVLPEMFSTGFSMDADKAAEAEDGETAAFLSATARRLGMGVIGGFAARPRGGGMARNLAAVYDGRGRLVASYAKLHPFSPAGEHLHYAPGEGASVFEVQGLRASVFICYDLRFPEAFRAVAREVQAVFVIANWPASRSGHWEALLRARAIENQCFVAGVNRAGTDGNGIVYHGGSRLYGPSGEEVCALGEAEECRVVEIDPDEVGRARERFPFLRDMRLS
ncbi:MAG: amidohydrolase [Thermodesulfovibrionales bacterium]